MDGPWSVCLYTLVRWPRARGALARRLRDHGRVWSPWDVSGQSLAEGDSRRVILACVTHVSRASPSLCDAVCMVSSRARACRSVRENRAKSR